MRLAKQKTEKSRAKNFEKGGKRSSKTIRSSISASCMRDESPSTCSTCLRLIFGIILLCFRFACARTRRERDEQKRIQDRRSHSQQFSVSLPPLPPLLAALHFLGAPRLRRRRLGALAVTHFVKLPNLLQYANA